MGSIPTSPASGGAKLSHSLLKKLGLKFVHTPLFSQLWKLPRPESLGGGWGCLQGMLSHAKRCQWADGTKSSLILIAMLLTKVFDIGMCHVDFQCSRTVGAFWTFERCQSSQESRWRCLSGSSQWCLVGAGCGRVDSTGLPSQGRHWVVGSDSVLVPNHTCNSGLQLEAKHVLYRGCRGTLCLFC